MEYACIRCGQLDHRDNFGSDQICMHCNDEIQSAGRCDRCGESCANDDLDHYGYCPSCHDDMRSK